MIASGEAKSEDVKLEEGKESENCVNNNENGETEAEAKEIENASDENVNNIEQDQVGTNETAVTSEGKNDPNNNDEN